MDSSCDFSYVIMSHPSFPKVPGVMFVNIGSVVMDATITPLFARCGGVRSHLMVLMAFILTLCFSAQRLLLEMLRGPYAVPKIEPG